MSSRTPALLLSLLILAVAVAAALWLRGTEAGPEAAAVGPAAVGEDPAASPAREALRPAPPAVAAAPEAPAEGETVGARSAVPAEREPEATEAANFELVASARFVDAHGLPVSGVRFSLETVGFDAEATSAPDGTAELRGDIEAAAKFATLPFRASHPRYVPRRIEVVPDPRGRVELGTVELAAAGRVVGRVLDASGAPAAALEVLCTARGPSHFGPAARERPSDELAGTKTGPQGDFRLEGVPVGDVRVWAGAEGWSWSYAEVAVQADGETRIDLRVARLAAENTIDLRVVDPSGAPVPGANVHYHYSTSGNSGSGSTNADEDGRLRHLLGVVTPHDFSATDPEGKLRPAVARGVAPGTTDLELRLGAERWLLLEVEEEGGEPITDFRVRPRLVGGEWPLGIGRHRSEAGKDGELALPLPPELFELEVVADGYQSVTSGPHEPERIAERLSLRLPALPGVRGRVLDAAGEPLSGASVSLHEVVREDQYLTVNGFRCRTHRSSEASGRTDAEGNFDLTLRGSGRFVLRAEASGLAPGELGPLELEAALGARGLELGLGRGGAIAGKVLPRPGESAAGVIVGASRGDGFGVTQLTDEDGRFRFEGLTPGRWWVERRDEEISPHSTSSSSGSSTSEQEIPWNCEVVEGGTARIELDLSRVASVIVAGRVLLGGVPTEGCTAALHGIGGGGELDSARLDSRGAFRIELDTPGRYELRVHGRMGPSGFGFLHQEVELEVGNNDWIREIPAGTIEGRASASVTGEGARLHLTWEGADGLNFFTTTELDEVGAFRVERFPAGEVELRLVAGDEERASTSVMLGAGEVARVDL